MRAFITEHPNRIYLPSAPNSESDFEQHILRCSDALFPDYYAAEWKPIIRDWRGQAARPDAILISKDMQAWYVVEIELSHHSIQGHIAPQLDTLNKGIYDSSLLTSIRGSVPDLDVDRLEELIYRPPGRLCVVDEYSDSIHHTCRENDFELSVIEPYIDVFGRAGLRVELMPSSLRREVDVTVFVLGRGRYLGDKELMQLPPHFPAYHGEITVVSLTGRSAECRIHVDNRQRQLVVPRDLIASGISVRLEALDISRRVFRLEVNK